MTDKQINTNQRPAIRVLVENGASIPAMQPVSKLPAPSSSGTSSGNGSSDDGGKSGGESSGKN
jgi:hypothetical protein